LHPPANVLAAQRARGVRGGGRSPAPEKLVRRKLLVPLLTSVFLGLPVRGLAAQEFHEDVRHWCQDFWMLTRAEILDCLVRDYAAADAELNRVYQEVMSSLPDDRREPLRASQRAWLARYDAVLTSYYSRPWSARSRVKVLPSQIRAVRDRTAYLRRQAGG
jgi:uncharacterized protein YecT (DUF1311 family)